MGLKALFILEHFLASCDCFVIKWALDPTGKSIERARKSVKSEKNLSQSLPLVN